MMGDAPLLVAEGISAGYGKIDILHGVSLQILPGEIVSVIGPNGAGKSTAFKTIVGFLPPRTGRVLFNGESIGGLRQLPQSAEQPFRGAPREHDLAGRLEPQLRPRSEIAPRR